MNNYELFIEYTAQMLLFFWIYYMSYLPCIVLHDHYKLIIAVNFSKNCVFLVYMLVVHINHSKYFFLGIFIIWTFIYFHFPLYVIAPFVFIFEFVIHTIQSIEIRKKIFDEEDNNFIKNDYVQIP